jgi:hypothetical protein
MGTIRSGGQTNLSGGWLKGVEELGRSAGEGPRKVLLLTDGVANVGVTDPGSLVEMTRVQAETSDVGTTTIGFGEDFDEDLLTAMADAGRGNAHYAPTPDAAPAIFAIECEGLMSLVAQNVPVEIRMSEDVAFLGLLNEFPTVAVPGGVQVSLGDAYDVQRPVLGARRTTKGHRRSSLCPPSDSSFSRPSRQTRFRLLHAFVGMEGGPPRPRCRIDGRRAANRSSDRGIASEPEHRRRIRSSGEEAGRGRTEPRARRRGGVIAPGHLIGGALGDSR